MKRFKGVGGGYLQRIEQERVSGHDDEDPDGGDHDAEAHVPPERKVKGELAELLQREM